MKVRVLGFDFYLRKDNMLPRQLLLTAGLIQISKKA
jgi:hypothetical protein